MSRSTPFTGHPVTKAISATAVCLAAVLVLAAPALAGHHRHHHHHHRAPARITVYNVCTLNPRLGAIYDTEGPEGEAIAYWDNSDRGFPEFLAISLDGDNIVDAAAFINSADEAEYLAFCDETEWIKVTPQIQSGSSGTTSGGSTSALEDLDNDAAALVVNPITPDASGCAGADSLSGGACFVEPDDGGY